MDRPFPCPELLQHPQIPKPLHGLNPRTILGTGWWDIARKKAYAKNNFHCYACGVDKNNAKIKHWLEGHETYIIEYKIGRVEFIDVVALCHFCHNFIHSGRLEMLDKAGKLPRGRREAILDHGYGVLMKAGVSSYPILTSNVKWKDWHLVIAGNSFPTKFKSYKEWQEWYKTGELVDPRITSFSEGLLPIDHMKNQW